jgi:phenylalanyl-tRNA synthetase beta chain
MQDPVRVLSRELRHTLASGFAATETYRYAFVSPQTLTALGFDSEEHLKLANPLASDRPYLVRSLLPNLLEAVAMNQHTFPTMSLFEIDRVFLKETKGDKGVKGKEEDEEGEGGMLPEQPYHLACVYASQGDESPLTALRNTIEKTLRDQGFDVRFRPITNPPHWMHSGRSADILVSGKKYGVLAELASASATKLGIDRRVAALELNLTELASHPHSQKAFASIPTFPDAKRDVAFTVAERTTAAAIEHAVREASKLLVEYDLFDIYRGKGVEEGDKSMAVHLSFRSPDKTLESNEVDQEVGKIRRVLEKEFGAIIRA